ncbi:uncharacterized protein LOC100240946 isoform X2 [Vitis vinifera]|uniref:uncharacterized protein LOC100240946 isoform X2 n=1 Tax=Vitis vinifera TaxID=29760 RepID=UPI00053FD3DC|nr:uncharacterized protein LOC100240946 isoform X2 [Vitis vinifera]|eukprot:XP_010663932.1 PREDICTED: uncharacterized protein LOC100240946 isoform X2 [Vitis vinifera]
MSHLPNAAAVLYHYPCPDGAFAALAAHLYLRATSTPTLFFPNRVYSPVSTHHLPLPQISHLYLLDFAGPPDFLPQVSPNVPQVTVLDHHKTALQLLQSWNPSNALKVIDVGRSGATIAFDYFKQRAVEEGLLDVAGEFERVRRVFEYVEDGDLWRWGLENSKAFSSGLNDMNLEFDVGLNPSLFDQAVNADSISELRSELGHQLASKSCNLKLRGIGAVVYRVPELKNDQFLKISLRSVDKEDTTTISQEYGGGGHRNASSFMLSPADFDKWKV